MINDPIVEKLHQQRRDYMERFGYDLEAIIRDIKAHEAAHPGPLLQPPSAQPPKASLQRSRYARR